MLQQPHSLRLDCDQSVAPGDDFYQYAVGTWLKHNPIPDEYSRWGSFEVLVEDNYLKLRTILEQADAYTSDDEALLARLVRGLYTAGMDADRLNRERHAPLAPYFEKIDAIATLDDVARVVGFLHSHSAQPLFHFGSTEDAKNSAMVIAGLGQGGITLPEREYYLENDERSVEVRKKYREHVARMFALVGSDIETAANHADVVLKIETALAVGSRTKEALRDPVANYNLFTVSGLHELAPSFAWNIFWETIGVTPNSIDVGQPDFFAAFTKQLEQTTIEEWKIYLRWHTLIGLAGFLSDDFSEETFAFYRQFLQGQKVIKPRWKRTVDAVDGLLGQALGRLYVRDHFSPHAKERALGMVQMFIETMGERIRALPWMGEATKEEALKKLATLRVKIGYPDAWIDYTSLTFQPGASYAEMAVAAMHFLFVRDRNKIDKPTDVNEWLMDPQTINAYYHPIKNEIVFPAGILQPPFFDANADDAVNYGGIGAVIGHEITHAFDDSGRQFDAAGNLRDWWTADDEKQFKARAEALVAQYDSFEALPGVHVNGTFTQGENIADLGGLYVAYTALKKVLPDKPELIEDFSPEQRFFLSYAQTWKNNIRDEKLRVAIMTDPHAPGKFRVLGPLSNMPAFYEAFGVGEGQRLYRDDDGRVVIW